MPMPRERSSGRADPEKILFTRCQVLDDASLVFDRAQNLTRLVRRLRRSMRSCQTCPGKSVCPLIEKFNSLVDQALEEVWDEWNAQINPG